MGTSSVKSKRSGCLLGQCLGDAIGFPAEGFPPEECLDYLHAYVKGWWYHNSEDGIFRFGQYTDDSQLARELARNLVDHKGYEPGDDAKRIVDLFTSNRIVGRGLACDAAANRLARGVSWEEAGCPPPSAGNGTAMRAAPVGMAYYDRPDLMIETARKQGWVTHRDPRCDAGSIAIAGAVALAIQGRTDPAEFCGQLADWMSAADTDFAEMVRELPDQLSMSPDQAVSGISVAGLSPGETPDWPGISPFVVPSVLWSLYCFLRTPDDCFESIWHSIACGGDVDTTGAMTGAISGAYLGVDALPKELLLRLYDGGRWRYAELSELANRLHEIFPVDQLT